MTENTETPEVEPSTELEVRTSPQILTRTDLRNRNTDSWTDVLVEVGDLANRIAGTDFVPASFKGSVPAVAATILQGRELGFPPMTALGSLHSIKGRVGLAAEAMRALVLQAGHEIVTEVSTSDKCKMKGRRKGSEQWTTVEWTMGDARQAGLLGSDGWKKYPRQMLQARASAELCRLAFPDVTRGLASLEEIEQYDVLPGEETATVGDGGTKVKRKRAPRKTAEKAEPPAPELDAPETGEEGVTSDPPSSPPEPSAGDNTARGPAVPEEDAGASVDPSPPDPEAPALPETDAEPDADPDTGEIVDAEIVEDPPEVLPPEEAEPGISDAQKITMIAKFNELGIKDRADRLYLSEGILGRVVESANELKRSEASSILDTLTMCKSGDELRQIVAQTIAHREKGDES